MDFQVGCIGHPGYDLALFLLSSTTKTFRQDHEQSLLEYYHNTLQGVLKKHHVDASFYTLDDVKEDYQEGLLTGVTFCIFGFPNILLEEGDEVSEVGEVDLKDSSAIEKLAKKEEKRLRSILSSNKNMRTRLREVMEEMVEKGIL